MSAVRKVATVRVSEPVDGRRRRKPRRPSTPPPVDDWADVDPQVKAAAVAARKPGTRLVRVNSTTIRIVNETP